MISSSSKQKPGSGSWCWQISFSIIHQSHHVCDFWPSQPTHLHQQETTGSNLQNHHPIALFFTNQYHHNLIDVNLIKKEKWSIISLQWTMSIYSVVSQIILKECVAVYNKIPQSGIFDILAQDNLESNKGAEGVLETLTPPPKPSGWCFTLCQSQTCFLWILVSEKGPHISMEMERRKLQALKNFSEVITNTLSGELLTMKRQISQISTCCLKAPHVLLQSTTSRRKRALKSWWRITTLLLWKKCLRSVKKWKISWTQKIGSNVKELGDDLKLHITLLDSISWEMVTEALWTPSLS